MGRMEKDDNIKTRFKNWSQNGNNYILHGNPKNRWVGFQQNVIDILKKKYNRDFYLVIYGDDGPNDFYRIPFQIVEHLFVSDHMTKDKNPLLARWTSIIENDVFKMHANSQYSVNVISFKGKEADSAITNELIDRTLGVDYLIEDSKATVKIRLGQSKFRNDVLNNFSRTCCITETIEENLLVASHIVPWAHNKNIRSDPCAFMWKSMLFLTKDILRSTKT
jgi:putative restriction endonuclease